MIEGKKILIEGGYLSVDRPENTEDWVWVKKTKEKTHCPFCQSENIAKKQNLNLAAVVLYFILGALFPLFRGTYKCYECGKAWKYKH